ncbi:Nodulin-16 protein [Spatholobus suberectus]|nr:Nodulin-16 protein [Spatholobus suberectus]
MGSKTKIAISIPGLVAMLLLISSQVAARNLKGEVVKETNEVGDSKLVGRGSFGVNIPGIGGDIPGIGGLPGGGGGGGGYGGGYFPGQGGYGGGGYCTYGCCVWAGDRSCFSCCTT